MREGEANGRIRLLVYKNDDFYWNLTLTVLRNVNKNRFITATIKILYTSDRTFGIELKLLALIMLPN
jgi:hypothetical protein